MFYLFHEVRDVSNRAKYGHIFYRVQTKQSGCRSCITLCMDYGMEEPMCLPIFTLITKQGSRGTISSHLINEWAEKGDKIYWFFTTLKRFFVFFKDKPCWLGEKNACTVQIQIGERKLLIQMGDAPINDPISHQTEKPLSIIVLNIISSHYLFPSSSA